MKYGLSEKNISSIQSVFAKYPEIESVILYGSRAKGNFKPGSDIDLTVNHTNLDFQKLNQIKNEIEQLNLPYFVDLSLKNEIENTDLLEHIQRVGIVFYKKQI